MVLALGVGYVLSPSFRSHREARALQRARTFLQKGDFQHAALSTRRLLSLNPNHLEGCRIMARLVDLGQTQPTLHWHQRVAQLSTRFEDKLELAARALETEPPPWRLATRTIQENAPAGEQSISYHLVAAELALRLEDLPEAEKHFERASLLEPSNPKLALNLAAFRLQSTNDAVVAQARARLESLRTHSDLRVAALRWLTWDQVRLKQWPAAERLVTELLTYPGVRLEDRLTWLTILHENHSPGFSSSLESVQRFAGTNAAAIGKVSAWMVAHDFGGNAFDWLRRCPSQVKNQYPVALAFAQTCVATTNWLALEDSLQNQQWEEMEFLRLALLARAWHGLERPSAALSHWRLACHRAADRPEALEALLAMAADCGQESGNADLLWQILRRFPHEQWTARALEELYRATGNTLGLNKINGVMAANDPKNVVAANNYATTSLLLRLNLAKAHALAQELYLVHAEDPIIASTYAYSLHVQGQTGAGLRIMEKLAPEELEKPGLALYYGALLWADRQTNKANYYLSLVRTNELLPEEKALMLR